MGILAVTLLEFGEKTPLAFLYLEGFIHQEIEENDIYLK